MKLNKKKFAIGLLSLTLFTTAQMPSYAGLGAMFAKKIVGKIIEKGVMKFIDDVAHVGLVELEPFEGTYATYIMNGFDYKLHDGSSIILPIVGVTNTAYGGVSTNVRDFFNVMGRATVFNYSNAAVYKGVAQNITLRKNDVSADASYRGMNAGFFNFADIDLQSGTIYLKGYDDITPSLSITTNGNLNLNDLSTLTFKNIINTIEYNCDRESAIHYIAYFINSNQVSDFDVSPTPTKGVIHDNVEVNGSIFMNVFDADIDREDYRPYVNYLKAQGGGNVIYNSADMALVSVSGKDSILINDKSHIENTAGKELPENQQTAGYILSLSTSDGFSVLNNEGALIDIYKAADGNNKPIIYNKGSINYVEDNYGVIDGLNIGKIDFKTKSSIGIGQNEKGKNNGTVKNTVLNIGNNLSFHNYKEF